jgi:hypothetical protein
MLPSFLVIGAQRAGSTFLHDNLVLRTSARSSPLQKEVHFFDNKYYRGEKWYARFFEKISPKDKTKVKNFETSPYYIYHPAVPKRVKKTMPNVKIIAILRNPVDRAISHYKWMRKIGIEKKDAVDAFKKDANRISKERDKKYLGKFDDPFYFDFQHIYKSYIRRSLYDIQIERWMKYFDKSSIRIVSSKKLFDNVKEVLKKLEDFLEIEYYGEGEGNEVNKNSSDDDTHVPLKARAIAKENLDGVVTRLVRTAENEMFLDNIQKIK